jgi:hypothetical protein
VRKKLERFEEERMRFRGVFVRYGKKAARKGPDLTTVLLKDVTIIANGQIVTDHVWFNCTKGFEALGTLQEGDVIEFDARVKTYVKGYFGRRLDVYKPAELDYKLSHPTKIVKVVER